MAERDNTKKSISGYAQVAQLPPHEITMTQKNLQIQNYDEKSNFEKIILDAMIRLALALQTIQSEKEQSTAEKIKTKINSDDGPSVPLAEYEGDGAHGSHASLTQLRKLWRPGGRQVCVYVAGTKGTGRISRLLQKLKHKSGSLRGTIFKIGTASPHRLEKRLAELCTQQYAAVQDGTLRLEPGFDCWKFRKINGIDNKHVPFFVDVMETAWRITLPADMTIEAFEADLRTGLESRSLRTWSQTPAGLAYLRERDIDPAICQRSSHYGMGLGARQSPSTELYNFDDKNDLPFLMGLVASIIERHVLAGEKYREPAANAYSLKSRITRH